MLYSEKRKSPESRLKQNEWRLKNKDRLNVYQRNWRLRHLEYMREYQRKYMRNWRTSDYNRACNKKYYEKYRVNELLRKKGDIMARKIEILSHYSNGTMTCACCGEKHIEFLTIDHINNDGAKHRKELANRITLYDWLKKNKYPSGFRVLCYNCNCARNHCPEKLCPHEIERNKLLEKTIMRVGDE